MSTRVTRQRSSGSGAAAGGSGGGGINKLQLRSGKQITLAKWMRLQHVPEYGIVEKVLPMHTGDDNDTARLPTTTSSNNANYGVAKTQEQVTASNMKTKKDAAIDSILSPTTQEIYSHIRYLSEEGIKLVLDDIDICASESLKYSAVEGGGGGGENSDNNNNNGCYTVHNLKTLAEVIHDYIQKFQPDYNDDDNNDDHDADVGGTKINNGDVSIEESEQQRTADDIMADMIHCGKSRKYCPTLLPFIIIKCYPNILDRSEMTKILSLDLSFKPATVNNLFDADVKRPSSSLLSTQSSSSSCVVTIKSTSNLVQQGHLVAEILSQCISNDPNGEEYAVELTRQRKRLKSQVSRVDVDGAPSSGGVGGGGVASIFSTWSWTNSLVDWCSTVDCFDSIIVLLEDVENIPSPVLDTFFTTLISLRSWHGIPINVVLMDSVPGGLGDRLSMLRNPSNHDSGGGDGGMAVCELELPLPQIQFDIFVNRLFLSGKCIPSFLWTNESIWDHSQEIFHEVDNSIISLARHLKSELRRYFTVPGAFLTLLHSKEFVIPNESRLKWLFGEESSRKFLSIQHASSMASSSGKKSAKNKQEDKKDGHIVDLFQKIQISYFCHQLLQKIYTIFDLTPFREVRLSTLTRGDVSQRVPKLIYFLQSARQRFASGETFEDSISILTKLDEYIILLGECANEAEEESVNQMAKLLVEDIIHWVEDCFPLQIVLSDPLPPSIQPRRDVAKALVSPLPKELSKHCLSYATRIAFQVFQSRVMTLSDWYNRYFEVVTQSGTTTNSREAAFFFAVYELIHLGFVRKVMTGRRSEETYEKIAMVWGSGR